MRATIKLAFSLGIPFLGSAYAQPAPSTELRRMGQAIQQLAQKVRPAIVQISARGLSSGDSPGEATQISSGVGSGFIVDPAGYILTNAHVVGDFKRVEVLLQKSQRDLAAFHSTLKPPSKAISAEVLGVDREADLAVLKVAQEGLPSLRFADSEKVQQGDLALAAGSPFGLENSVTLGVVSSVARQMRPDDPMIYLQTDAAINPGNSGGPLIDADGAVIGINTMIATQSGGSEGIGFAVPSNIVNAVYEQIRKYGRVRRGYIGVIAQTITPDFAEALQLSQDWGAIIADISPHSAAEAAGLEIRDIVLTLDGKHIENARQFGVSIYRHRGESVTLELLRNGQKVTKQVAVMERPKDPERLTSLIQGDANRIAPLGIFAVDLDEKVTPALPATPRKLSGAVVAGIFGARPRGESLLPGDIIYELNGKKIDGLNTLKAAIASLRAGQAVVAHVERMGQLQFLAMRPE